MWDLLVEIVKYLWYWAGESWVRRLTAILLVAVWVTFGGALVASAFFLTADACGLHAALLGWGSIVTAYSGAGLVDIIREERLAKRDKGAHMIASKPIQAEEPGKHLTPSNPKPDIPRAPWEKAIWQVAATCQGVPVTWRLECEGAIYGWISKSNSAGGYCWNCFPNGVVTYDGWNYTAATEEAARLAVIEKLRTEHAAVAVSVRAT